MAYSSTIDDQKTKRSLAVVITETEAAATSEVEIELGFKHGRILMQKCHLTSGTGTTVDPIIGTVTNPASSIKDIVVQNDTAAQDVANQLASPGVPFYTPTGNLFHRSMVNDGTDNDITTEYHIVQGWD